MDKPKGRALVTGGAGFIAGHIARDLINRGWEVVILDNLRTGNKENIPLGSTFLEVDVGKNEYENIFENPFDLVYHFAGQSSVEISYADPIYDIETNVKSTLILLKHVEKYCPQAHFIYASSMSVYGGFEPMPKKETMTLDGENFYAIGKKASEEYMKIYSKKGLKTTAIRLFNIYGPGQNLANLSQGMVSIYVAQAIKNSKIVIKGSLKRTRDFVYIYDVINYLRKIENNKNSFSKAINLCSGEEFTVEVVVDHIRNILNKNIEIISSGSTPGDISRMVGDNSLIKEITGSHFHTSLYDGIAEMIKRYNEDKYYK